MWVVGRESSTEPLFTEDVDSCMKCGGRMDLRAVVIHPPATAKVLTALLGEGFGGEPSDFE